jgi:hypothetical protein
MYRALVALASLLLATSVPAQQFPDMVGTWTGTFQTVSSGISLRSEVARGGALIAETTISLVIHHQEGEVFIGDTKNRETAVTTPVWGAIRSTGKEGIFVTSTGGSGNIWFDSPIKFEFCFASQSESALSAYCGVFNKQISAGSGGR